MGTLLSCMASPLLLAPIPSVPLLRCSVIVAPIRDGFTLQRMGTPEEAAARFLSTTGAGGSCLRSLGRLACMPAFHASPAAAAAQASDAFDAPIHLPLPAVAPEGSGKTAVLLGAGSRVGPDDQLYYWQEFTVESAKWKRHNLSGEGAAREG